MKINYDNKAVSKAAVGKELLEIKKVVNYNADHGGSSVLPEEHTVNLVEDETYTLTHTLGRKVAFLTAFYNHISVSLDWGTWTGSADSETEVYIYATVTRVGVVISLL